MVSKKASIFLSQCQEYDTQKNLMILKLNSSGIYFQVSKTITQWGFMMILFTRVSGISRATSVLIGLQPNRSWNCTSMLSTWSWSRTNATNPAVPMMWQTANPWKSTNKMCTVSEKAASSPIPQAPKNDARKTWARWRIYAEVSYWWRAYI